MATKFRTAIGAPSESVITTPSAATRVAGGTGTVTDATLAITTGLSTIVGYSVTLAEDPGAGAGDVFTVSATASGGTLTVSIWQDDATAATEDTTVAWTAIGT